MSKKIKFKFFQGSVLVFTLIVLFIILASAIGISSVSVLERKGAGSTDISVQSFQIANSGAEIILKKIADNPGAMLSELGDCDSGTGKVTGFISISPEKKYEITFYNTSDGLPITDCGITASNVDKIKSVGSYANTARAIEVAVAASGAPSISNEFTAGLAPAPNIWTVCFLTGSDDGADCRITGTVDNAWTLTGGGVCRARCLKW